MENGKWKMENGFSLLEMLVVISVFVILAAIASQSLISILGGTAKSEVSRVVRQNADYALSVMTRNLRSAIQISECSQTKVSYIDPDGAAASFSCEPPSSPTYIASGSARLTSTDVTLTVCSFSCLEDASATPVAVEIKFDVSEAGTKTSVTEKSTFSVSSRVNLRSQ